MTLQLEVGKYYRTRDGKRSGPVYLDGDVLRARVGEFLEDGLAYFRNGKLICCEHDDEDDLIAEWDDEPAPFRLEAGKFYRTRDGRKEGPLRAWGPVFEGKKLWHTGRYSVFGHGGRFPRGWPYSMDDLVAEWIDEPVSLSRKLVEKARYDALRDILDEAVEQAAAGKGAERHANGRPFQQQPICATTRAVGIGFPLGQAMKKAEEAAGMLQREENSKAVHELLGAINYLAAAIIVIRERG